MPWALVVFRVALWGPDRPRVLVVGLAERKAEVPAPQNPDNNQNPLQPNFFWAPVFAVVAPPSRTCSPLGRAVVPRDTTAREVRGPAGQFGDLLVAPRAALEASA